jgi:hypothetical protein
MISAPPSRMTGETMLDLWTVEQMNLLMMRAAF